ncbi:hypothetical protein BC939DRAFT_448009, partial [Gamsiella multidivaricata]|uniref:uncharacterized protein n=1 Tax=Gamsiella multidivaricata TaxID=101098 RepID=UPI00222110B5
MMVLSVVLFFTVVVLPAITVALPGTPGITTVPLLIPTSTDFTVNYPPVVTNVKSHTNRYMSVYQAEAVTKNYYI